MASTARIANHTSTHAGMLNPRNFQFTSAHSPEPVNTIASASRSGNVPLKM